MQGTNLPAVGCLRQGEAGRQVQRPVGWVEPVAGLTTFDSPNQGAERNACKRRDAISTLCRVMQACKNARRPSAKSYCRLSYSDRVRLGLAAFAALMLFSGILHADPVMTDWTRVVAVQPGKRILVRLYKDSAPPGSVAMEGQFASATVGGISIVQRDGTPRTIARERIRRVAVWRATKKRARNAAIVGAVGAGVGMVVGIAAIGIAGGGGTWHEGLVASAILGVLVSGPLALASAFGEPRDVIFNVPPNHRRP